MLLCARYVPITGIEKRLCMRRWQPPIPAGALYAPATEPLGPAVRMLAWCYDQVERDGWLTVRLDSAAVDLGKPYGTIKDWWRLLRSGPFFSAKQDTGHNGYRVRFADDWLDWRSTSLDTERQAHQGGNVNLDTDIPAYGVSTQGGNINPETPLNTRPVTLQGGDVNLNGSSKQLQGSAEGGDFNLENLHVGTHVFQHPPPPPTPHTASCADRTDGGGGGSLRSTQDEPDETLAAGRKEKAAGPGRNPPLERTETECWLVASGMGAKNAHTFRDLPLAAVQADVARRRAEGARWGAICDAWGVSPPGSAPPPPPPMQPRRAETPEEAEARMRRVAAHIARGY